MEKVFIVGATGYVGREVVCLLAEQGVEVVAHVRSDSPRIDEWKNRFHKLGARVDATPWDSAAMTVTIKKLKPDLIFSLLGTTRARMRESSEKVESYEAVDYGLTALLIDSTLQAQIRPRFVYLSSAGAGPRARGSYLKARWHAEDKLTKSNLPYTIARPSIITGLDRDDNRPLERWGSLAADTLLTVAGVLGMNKLRDRYSSTTNTVLAKALIHHALDPNSENRVIESEYLRDSVVS